MKTILCIMPSPNDSTAFYRVIVPFERLKNTHKIILSGRVVSQNDLTFCDIVFFQRPTTQSHLDIITTAKALGKRVWLDYDDNLLDLPSDSPCEVDVVLLGKILRKADIITVSTDLIKELWKNFNTNIVVVNNSNIDLSCDINVPRNTKRILWRGSATHFKDLATISDQLISFLKNNKYEMILIGYKPWFICDYVKCVHVPTMNILSYFTNLWILNADIQIVPLFDSKFNRCKSNISWIEATVHGRSQVVAPDFEEFNKPGVINYKDGRFVDSLYEATEVNNQKQSLEYINENLNIDKINEKRIEILEKIC